jgi:hypothetical protein
MSRRKAVPPRKPDLYEVRLFMPELDFSSAELAELGKSRTRYLVEELEFRMTDLRYQKDAAIVINRAERRGEVASIPELDWEMAGALLAHETWKFLLDREIEFQQKDQDVE